jgi:uncharacterized protein
MKLKSAVSIGSIALLLTASGALAQDAARKAKIEEMFRITNMDRMVQQIMSQMKTVIDQQLSTMKLPPEAEAEAQESQDRMMKLIAERMSWEKMKPAYIQLYDEVFTDEELDGILAFYRSPAGRAMIEKTPLLMTKAVALSQKQMGDLQPEIQKMMKELDAKHKK